MLGALLDGAEALPDPTAHNQAQPTIGVPLLTGPPPGLLPLSDPEPSNTLSTTRSHEGHHGGHGTPPPIIGQPPLTRPTPELTDDETASRTERERPESRGAALRASDDSGAYGPGVQPQRLLQTLVELLRLPCSLGSEEAVLRYVRARVGAMRLPIDDAGSPGAPPCLTLRLGPFAAASSEALATGPLTGNPTSADTRCPATVEPTAPQLLLMARLDAEDPPVPPIIDVQGNVLRLQGRGRGLHGRAGVAVLLEFLEVWSARGLRTPGPAIAFVGQGGARALPADMGRVPAAFCLDGFLADEALDIEPERLSPGVAAATTGVSGGAAAAASAARRMAERALAQRNRAASLDNSVSRPWAMLAAQLQRIGLPLWRGRMQAAGSPGSVLAARGVPTVIMGCGVAGGCSGDEAFHIMDAVLCARLLMALSSPGEGPAPIA